MTQQALGLIETRGYVGIVEAADAAAKAASVRVSGFEKIEGGFVSIRFLGDVGAVHAAIASAAAAAAAVGELVSQHVIPNPHEDLVAAFRLNGGGSIETEDLDALSVTELRRLARETEGLGIQGREISHANRERLIQELEAAREGQAD